MRVQTSGRTVQSPVYSRSHLIHGNSRRQFCQRLVRFCNQSFWNGQYVLRRERCNTNAKDQSLRLEGSRHTFYCHQLDSQQLFSGFDFLEFSLALLNGRLSGIRALHARYCSNSGQFLALSLQKLFRIDCPSSSMNAPLKR